uniref:hypothetical protein n=1 Tax=Salmonella sp. SAL4435 TaxID=3159890 RepID=UPI003979DABE
KVRWKIAVGEGLGSFAIKGDKVFYLAASGDNEDCYAVSLMDGSKIWTTPLGQTQGRGANQGGGGPGSTPCADGDFVYCYSSLMKLYCMQN